MFPGLEDLSEMVSEKVSRAKAQRKAKAQLCSLAPFAPLREKT